MLLTLFKVSCFSDSFKFSLLTTMISPSSPLHCRNSLSLHLSVPIPVSFTYSLYLFFCFSHSFSLYLCLSHSLHLYPNPFLFLFILILLFFSFILSISFSPIHITSMYLSPFSSCSSSLILLLFVSISHTISTIIFLSHPSKQVSRPDAR